MNLDGETRRALDAALARGFSYAELERLARYKLNLDLEDIVSGRADKRTAVFQLVGYAERRKLLPKLIEGARSLNPALGELQWLFQLTDTGPVLARDGLELEKIVSERSQFQNPTQFRDRMGSIETWVCRIEIPGGGGSGLLVYGDLVLTNQHVMAPVYDKKVSRDDVIFRFDYKALPDGTELIGETRCGLADAWDVDQSPPSLQDRIIDGAEPQPDELDYALVRLREPAGRERINSSDPEAPPRRWYQLVTPPAIVKGEPFMVMQYPGDLRLQLAMGSVLEHTPGGTRVRHDARTLNGSSGSPCFDANLKLVAMHHAGEPDREGRRPKYNQAIPVGRILDLMQKNGVPPFWREAPL
jgi:hypothetical protein